MRADEVIKALGLQQLPVEGGSWAQSWRSAECSAIHYLLAAPEFSGVHRLNRLEIYAFHGGAPVRMLLLHPDGTVTEPVLGMDLGDGQRPQVAVPAGVWQASETLGEWSLVGTVVVPPYQDDSVEFGRADELCAEYPAHAARIRALSRA
ncbi:cupin domain-containing protein [Solihabitans fulvus]|uniref:Cupin domain-containing protein n=1 Tax=Solihabitans fulvus TaxID=1892852 RepID=A0A5B2XGK3_9PSEU|nr:cupin domain-containing protein [Solihabitans fulvus]KAA2261912.1 cupin domain-containing protein [Solihabitans fulvus]